ncbi:hypothetical protein CSE16_06810 [Solibacillus sp. R5-41]|uniref:hypothetical protein n=1 Tax=Solibacillus sp. R5-41 TaxID=2048654 RepID=UPI000C129947|nr:hypothetical protein [Solibacillus sp. R5-41]ATP39787.1 hypothetical protein CSE16_06810 [Solibacillus sp. R5-41]
MPKYISENCFENIEWQSVCIEKAKVKNDNLYLTFESLVIIKEHPLNPFDTEMETNDVELVFYDFEVLDSGYYDCSHIEKQLIDYDRDCTYIAVPLLKLIKDFTIVTEDIKDKNELFFEQTFEGFPRNFGEDAWGYFKIRYKRMEMLWDSFYSE